MIMSSVGTVISWSVRPAFIVDHRHCCDGHYFTAVADCSGGWELGVLRSVRVPDLIAHSPLHLSIDALSDAL